MIHCDHITIQQHQPNRLQVISDFKSSAKVTQLFLYSIRKLSYHHDRYSKRVSYSTSAVQVCVFVCICNIETTQLRQEVHKNKSPATQHNTDKTHKHKFLPYLSLCLFLCLFVSLSLSLSSIYLPYCTSFVSFTIDSI